MTHVCRLCSIEHGSFMAAFNCCIGLSDEEIRKKKKKPEEKKEYGIEDGIIP